MEKNTTAKRITKSMRYEDIIALLKGDAPAYGTDLDTAIEFIHKEMALLAKKNSSDNKKPTATQTANEGYRALIMSFLAVQSKPRTCTEIAKGIPELSDFNNQKVASLVKRLVDEEKVNKQVVKGKSVFSIR